MIPKGGGWSILCLLQSALFLNMVVPAPQLLGWKSMNASSHARAKSTFLMQAGAAGGLIQYSWSSTKAGRTMTHAASAQLPPSDSWCSAIKQRDVWSSSMSLSLTVEKRMFSCQASTSLFTGQSNQGAFFSAIIFLQHGRATGTMWHASHSKWHEAGFVLANERSSWCWTCSISDWATHPGSQQWSVRAASSHTHSWLPSRWENALQSQFTQFHLVCSSHRPYSSSSKAATELYSSKNTKQLHGWNLP